MKKILNNERGNITIFVLGLLIINMVLFVFVLNLGSVFATKEKSASIAQQASLVATSVFYEEVRKVIVEYEDETLEGELLAFFEDFDEKVDERKNYLINSGSYSGWSVNEVETEAFDQVLNEELNKEVVRMKLRELIIDENVEDKVIQRVIGSITKNDGLIDRAQLMVKDDKFHVKASQEFTSTEYDDFIKQFKENVYQKSSGPEIAYLERIWNRPNTINLDE